MIKNTNSITKNNCHVCTYLKTNLLVQSCDIPLPPPPLLSPNTVEKSLDPRWNREMERE